MLKVTKPSKSPVPNRFGFMILEMQHEK